jgi:hypothetical protein
MQGPLDAFRSLLLSDASLQSALGAIDRPETFIAQACEAARGFDLALVPDELAAALRPDPLGLISPPGCVIEEGWPAPGWRPIAIASTPDGRGEIEWIYFGPDRLDEPFFEMSVRRARARPFNRLIRRRMGLDEFVARAPAAAAPRGLVFHMSRCGSTLVAQMLAAARSHVVLSEAPPIDQALRLRELRPEATDAERRRLLVAMIAALSRGSAGEERAGFVKLDSWHTLALPLFRAAFPSTPWVYLYRDPVEVLVSQMRARGLQTVPGMLPAELQGLVDGEALGAEDVCAQALARGCEAAVEHFGLGGGLLVSYDELPEAVFTKILPHFGLSPDGPDRDAMRAAALRDAKAPHSAFAPDREEKRRAATARIHDAAARRLATVHARLDALRAEAR